MLAAITVSFLETMVRQLTMGDIVLKRVTSHEGKTSVQIWPCWQANQPFELHLSALSRLLC
jgi:hypothetical protein